MGPFFKLVFFWKLVVFLKIGVFFENWSFSLDPSYRRGRVYKLKFCLFVCLYVITSTFPFYGLQIIPESCQIPHIMHHWKESDANDAQTDTHKDKDNCKNNIFKNQIVQRYQIWHLQWPRESPDSLGSPDSPGSTDSLESPNR